MTDQHAPLVPTTLTNAVAPTEITPPGTMDLAIAAWIDAKCKRSAKTKRAYEDTLRQFRAALQHQSLDLDTLARDDGTGRNQRRDVVLVAQAFASFSSRGTTVTPATFNQRLAILSSFYEYARKKDYLEHNPIQSIDREAVQPYAKARALPPEHTTTVLRAIDRTQLLGARNYTLLAVLLQTGRRLSEVASLRWEHVTVLGSLVTLTFEHCKGGKVMIDTLDTATSRALLIYLQLHYGAQLGTLPGSSPIWVNLSPDPALVGQALGPQAIADVCKKYLGTSKVHTTRHTYAQNMKQLGASTRTIRDRLGHASEATTEHYLEQLQRADNPYADLLAALQGIE